MKFLVFISCCICLNFSTKIDDKIESIKVYKTNFNNEPIADVGCDDFYGSFIDLIDTFDISDNVLQYKILHIIRTAKPYKVKPYSKDPDTRARMFIYYKSGKVDSLCFGAFRQFVLNNNTLELPDDKLIKILIGLEK